MKLYLIQHAKSSPKNEDPKQDLTEDGILKTNKIAEFFSKKITFFELTIYHSEKLRSEHTAKIFFHYLKPLNHIEIIKSEGLKPLDDPLYWIEKLKKHSQDVMIIGHLPFLEKFAESLLKKKKSDPKIQFHNSGIICLEKYPENKWEIDFEIIPDQI